jgi:hypothetical protein
MAATPPGQGGKRSGYTQLSSTEDSAPSGAQKKERSSKKANEPKMPAAAGYAALSSSEDALGDAEPPAIHGAGGDDDGGMGAGISLGGEGGEALLSLLLFRRPRSLTENPY